MKFITKTLAASALVIAFTGTASAMVSPDLKQDIISAAGANSNVQVLVDGGTVTLTGYVEDAYALSQAMHAADSEGVDRVINNLLRSN